MSFTYQVSVDSSGRRSLVRVSNPPTTTMRPWEREQLSSSSPVPDSSPPRPAKGSLSSLVVKPSADELASSRQDDTPTAEKPLLEPRRHPSRAGSPSPPWRPRPRRPPEDSVGCTFWNEVVASNTGHNLSVHSVSLSPHQRTIDRRYDHYFDHPGRLQGRQEIRDENNGDGFRDHSPTHGHGRGRANLREISPPYARASDGGRFREYSTIKGRGRGGRVRLTQFGRRGGRSFRHLSPPAYERERNGQRYLLPAYEKERDRERLHFSPSYSPDRDGRRFRVLSPIYDPETGGGRFREKTPPLYGQRKDARLFNRNFDGPESEPLPVRDEGTNRNNPNIPPRVGDWICRNPSCGNLNFARREYCNNCNKFRYEPGEGGRSSSPHRRYSGGPHPMDHPAPIQADHGFRREINGYRSPPPDWPRDSPRGPRRHGGRFSDIAVGRETLEYRRDVGFRGKDKFDRLPPREWDHQEQGPAELLRERRGCDRNDDIWGPREKSRLPIKSLLAKERRYDLSDDGWGPKKRSRSPIGSLPPKEKRHDHDDDGWGPRERSRSPIRSLSPKGSRYATFGGRGRGDKRAIARGRGRDLF